MNGFGSGFSGHGYDFGDKRFHLRVSGESHALIMDEKTALSPHPGTAPDNRVIMQKRRGLLVGWDAIDRKVINPLMDAGKMPNVRRLVENGDDEADRYAGSPLSPMLWTVHCPGEAVRQAMEFTGFRSPRRMGAGFSRSRIFREKAKRIWNILNQHDLRSVVIGWWPSHPAEPIPMGVMVFGSLSPGQPVAG